MQYNVSSFLPDTSPVAGFEHELDCAAYLPAIGEKDLGSPSAARRN